MRSKLLAETDGALDTQAHRSTEALEEQLSDTIHHGVVAVPDWAHLDDLSVNQLHASIGSDVSFVRQPLVLLHGEAEMSCVLNGHTLLLDVSLSKMNEPSCRSPV
jgi:hypothetical protein